MEASPGVGLGRPVQRSLQFWDLVLLGGTSHEGTHQPFPARDAQTKQRPFPSPPVLLSGGLKRYYGRLRRPPGSPPTSRLSTGYKARRSDALPQPPGRVGPPQFPPSPSERSAPSTPEGSSGLHIQALHPFHGLHPEGRGSAPPQPGEAGHTNDAAGFASMLRTAQSLPQMGFRRWAPTRPVTRPSRQPATGPPGSYPDGTHTRRQRRAYVRIRSNHRPPPNRWAPPMICVVPMSLAGRRRRRENGGGLPATPTSPWLLSPLCSLAPVPGLDGSRTVATSTPVSISVP